MAAIVSEGNEEPSVEAAGQQASDEGPAPTIAEGLLRTKPPIASASFPPANTAGQATIRPQCDPAKTLEGPQKTLAQNRRLRAKKERSHMLRKKNRADNKKQQSHPPCADANIRPNISARYSNQGPRMQCSTDGRTRAARNGFIGLNDRDDPQSNRQYTLAEVTGEGSELNFKLKEWDGRTPIVIIDQSGRVIAVLAGSPDDQDWTSVHQEAAAALEANRERCSFAPESLSHRRGQFLALNCGVSFGGGQRQPMNLKNTDTNAQVADDLCSLKCFQRIAGFGSAVLKHRAPLIYNHYVKNIQELDDWEKEENQRRKATHPNQDDIKLKRPFDASVFSASTFNMGPQTICCKHKDYANLAFGWCALTALGDFDYKQGGHLILWECEIVIEFPPGATILLPSAVISHSNVTIQQGEKHFSFTQYTSGGLFRWARNGFQTATRYFSHLTTQEKCARDVEDANRWSLGLSL